MTGSGNDPLVIGITGVTAGLGRELATQFTQRGAHVVGCGRRAELGAELAADLVKMPGRFTFVRTDLSDPVQCREFVAEVVERGGRIDGLLNNAGGHFEDSTGPSRSTTAEAWDQTFALNVRAPFFCSIAAAELMRTQSAGGAIVNIASVQAVEAVEGMAAYNAAKAALVQVSRTLAVEYRNTRVRVNVVLLGGVETEGSPDLRRWLVEGSGVARSDAPPVGGSHNDPQKMAAALWALLNADSETITGATIAIDRGLSAGAAFSDAVLRGAAARYYAE